MRRFSWVLSLAAVACTPSTNPQQETETSSSSESTATESGSTTDTDSTTDADSDTDSDTDTDTDTDTDSTTDTGDGDACPDAPPSVLLNPGCGFELCGNGIVDIVEEETRSCEEQCDTQPTTCGAVGYPSNQDAEVPCLEVCRFDVAACDECVAAGNTVACVHPSETQGSLTWFELAPRGAEIGAAWQELGDDDTRGVTFARYDANLQELSRTDCLPGRAYVALATIPEGWVLASSSFDGGWFTDLRRIDASGAFVGEPFVIPVEGDSPRVYGREAQGGLLVTNVQQGDSTAHRIADDGTLAWSLELDLSEEWDANFDDGIADGEAVILVGGFDVAATRVTLDGAIDWHTPIAEGRGVQIARTDAGFDVYYSDFDANDFVAHLSPAGAVESIEPLVLDGLTPSLISSLPTASTQPLLAALSLEGELTTLDIQRLDGSPSYRLAEFPLGLQSVESAWSELGIVLMWDANGVPDRFGMALLDEP